MITLYTGTPGSGKSLHMARRLFNILNRRKKSIVIANFEIDLSRVKHPDRFIYVSNNGLSPDFLRDLAFDFFMDNPLQESSIFLFIDECQIIFNSRRWQEKGRNDWLVFFTQHRKFGFDIILTSQFDLMIDKQIRSLIEYEIVHRKITNYGCLGFLLRILSFGQPVFIAIEKWYSINQKTSSYIFFARKRFYSLYDTFNTFRTA